MCQELIATILIFFILFVLFPLALAFAKKIEPVTYTKDVIIKAYELIKKEEEILKGKQNKKPSPFPPPAPPQRKNNIKLIKG